LDKFFLANYCALARRFSASSQKPGDFDTAFGRQCDSELGLHSFQEEVPRYVAPYATFACLFVRTTTKGGIPDPQARVLLERCNLVICCATLLLAGYNVSKIDDCVPIRNAAHLDVVI